MNHIKYDIPISRRVKERKTVTSRDMFLGLIILFTGMFFFSNEKFGDYSFIIQYLIMQLSTFSLFVINGDYLKLYNLLQVTTKTKEDHRVILVLKFRFFQLLLLSLLMTFFVVRFEFTELSIVVFICAFILFFVLLRVVFSRDWDLWHQVLYLSSDLALEYPRAYIEVMSIVISFLVGIGSVAIYSNFT